MQEEAAGLGRGDFVGSAGSFEQTEGIFGFEFTNPDAQKETGHGANHFVEEAFPFDTYLHIPFPRAGYGDAADGFYGAADFAVWVDREGCKVVLADQCFRCALHGVDIERSALMQTIEAQIRRNGHAVPDEVAVFLSGGAEAGVEVVFHLLNLHNTHIGIQECIEAVLKAPKINRLFQIKMSRLPFGMNTGIRSPGMVNADFFPSQNLKSPFNLRLHGVPARLHLPACIVRAVVGDSDLVSSAHGVMKYHFRYDTPTFLYSNIPSLCYAVPMFQYQQHNQYFAQIAGGFEELAEAELKSLGAKEIRADYRGFHFSASLETLYRINYTARLIVRVLAPLITFDCHSDKYLHQTAMKIDWSQFMTSHDTFAINAVTSNTPGLKHSQYAALKLKDAICDFFRNQCGERPSVDVKSPDLGIHLFVRNNRAVISIDTSGGSLHKRGYRTARVEAPLAETLAAAIIRLSAWDGDRPLFDPMCGSGTLLCEAAMSYGRIPQGFFRKKFGFEKMPDFNPAIWKALKTRADASIRPLPNSLLFGSDNDPQAIRATRVNVGHLPGCKNALQAEVKDFHNIEKLENTIIVVNPPYGVRIGSREAAEALLKEFGDFLKQRCTGCTAYVYAGDRKLLKKVGLKPEWKNDLNNGGLEGVLGKYELY